MANVLAGYAPQAYALMRIIVGTISLCLQKVFGLFGGVNGPPPHSLISILPEFRKHGVPRRVLSLRKRFERSGAIERLERLKRAAVLYGDVWGVGVWTAREAIR